MRLGRVPRGHGSRVPSSLSPSELVAPCRNETMPRSTAATPSCRSRADEPCVAGSGPLGLDRGSSWARLRRLPFDLYHHADGFARLMEGEWLPDHASATGLNPDRFVVLERAVGQDEDAAVQLGVPENGLLDPEQWIVTVHDQVDDHGVDADRAHDFGCLGDTRRGKAHMAVGLEGQSDQFRQERLVVDDQDLHHRPPSRRPSTLNFPRARCSGKYTVVAEEVGIANTEFLPCRLCFGWLEGS